MQDEVNSKVVALSVRMGSATARLTARVLRLAMQKYLAENHKGVPRAAARDSPKHGKQTVGQLMKQESGLTNIEITDKNIRSFERTAKKYNIDYALKKDKNADPPRYLVFFKARDVDVMTAAFKEYSSRELTKSRKPSVRHSLHKAQERVRKQQRERSRNRAKERAEER